MLYPTLNPENTSRDFIDVFGGYNHNLRIQDNEFYDMQNMSSSKYPLLSSRPKRGAAPSSLLPPIGGMVGMLYRSALYTVSYYQGSGAYPLHVYKGGTEIAQFLTDVPAAEKRELIMMGAYLIVLPDKVYVNTVDLTQTGYIEAEASTGSNPTIQLCTEDGSVISIDYAGRTAPDNPSDGYVWLDTSNEPPMIKKYFASNAMWSADIVNYIKLTSDGLSADFAEGDGVKISGITAESFTHLNNTTILKTKPDDDTMVLNAQFESVDGNYRFFEVARDYASKSTIELISDVPVTADQFRGVKFVVGNKKVTCASNTASSYERGWKISDTFMLTNLNHNLTSINEYQNIAAAQAGNPARLFVQLENGETIKDPTTNDIHVFVGDGEEQIPYKIQVADSQAGYIILNNSEKIDVPASTTIYPLEYGDLAGRYIFTISFDLPVKAKTDTAVLIDPDFITTQSGAITVSRKMPIMDFVFENQNRLWGCRYGENSAGETVNEIYASKLGDFKNWQCYQGVSTDSYTASCGTDGEWTGAISFLGKPTFFKENYIHTVYGSYPAQYQINSTVARGVQQGSNKSLAIINEVLYYLSSEGVCTYNGSLPVNISNAFGDIRYHGGIAAGFNGKYYISMRNNSPVLMVYDTKRSLWHKEDNADIEYMCSVADDIYYIEDGNFRAMFSGTDSSPVPWFAETGEYGLSMPDSKYISRLNLRLALDRDANAMISIQYDSSGIWEKLCNITRRDIKPFTLPIKPRRCDHFRLKIEGNGGMRIYSISKTISQGGDRT